MLNLSGMLKAPMHNYEVSMQRKTTISDSQNVRRKVAYVKAPNEAEAKRLAERNNPAFKAGKTRRV
jgi:hypothetical protein